MIWSGTTIAEMVTPNWPWAIVAGLAVSAITGLGLRRMAPAEPRAQEGLVVPFMWEGVVFGGAAKVGAGALAIVASLLVILVHHLGYREFRGRASRPALVGALFGCGLQALAFLLTGNVVAPVIAHIVLHWQVVVRGMELPPSERDTASPWAKAEPTRPLVPVGR